MTLTYTLLGLAIAFEVSGTLALRQTDGFSKVAPSIAVGVCYVLAFVLLSFVLKRGLPVAVAYALWSAAGILVIAVIGWLFLDERLTFLQGLGMGLVVVGVVTVELGTQIPEQTLEKAARPVSPAPRLAASAERLVDERACQDRAGILNQVVRCGAPGE